VQEQNWRLYVKWEAEVKRRCLATIAALGPASLFVQLAGGSATLAEAAAVRLGAARVLRLAGGAGPGLAAAYADQAAQIESHLARHGLGYDPATATAVMISHGR
jgi:hypothetical protein